MVSKEEWSKGGMYISGGWRGLQNYQQSTGGDRRRAGHAIHASWSWDWL